jgi:hypothetical protein
MSSASAERRSPATVLFRDAAFQSEPCRPGSSVIEMRRPLDLSKRCRRSGRARRPTRASSVTPSSATDADQRPGGRPRVGGTVPGGEQLDAAHGVRASASPVLCPAPYTDEARGALGRVAPKWSGLPTCAPPCHVRTPAGSGRLPTNSATNDCRPYASEAAPPARAPSRSPPRACRGHGLLLVVSRRPWWRRALGRGDRLAWSARKRGSVRRVRRQNVSAADHRPPERHALLAPESCAGRRSRRTRAERAPPGRCGRPPQATLACAGRRRAADARGRARNAGTPSRGLAPAARVVTSTPPIRMRRPWVIPVRDQSKDMLLPLPDGPPDSSCRRRCRATGQQHRPALLDAVQLDGCHAGIGLSRNPAWLPPRAH